MGLWRVITVLILTRNETFITIGKFVPGVSAAWGATQIDWACRPILGFKLRVLAQEFLPSRPHSGGRDPQSDPRQKERCSLAKYVGVPVPCQCCESVQIQPPVGRGSRFPMSENPDMGHPDLWLAIRGPPGNARRLLSVLRPHPCRAGCRCRR